jgi:hypothetical protein
MGFVPHLALGALVLLGAGCSSPPQPIAPARAAVSGDTARFGSGPVALSVDGRHVVLQLKRPARAWFFNAHPGGWVDLLTIRSVPEGRSEIVVPYTAVDRRGGAYAASDVFTSVTTRRDLDRMGTPLAHGRVRTRDALLVVVHDGTVAPDPHVDGGGYRFFRVVDDADPASVPEVMFRSRPGVAWASYMIRPPAPAPRR